MKAIKNFLIITIPTLILLVIILEIFFRYGLPACQSPVSISYDENDMFMYDTTFQKEGLWVVGKFAEVQGKWKVNNYVWNSEIDYSKKKDPNKKRIAIIGGSQMEALTVDYNKSLASILRNEVGDKYEVYRFGKSRAQLGQMLHINRYVNKLFDPDIVIINYYTANALGSVMKTNRIPEFLQFDINNNKVTEVPPQKQHNSPLYDFGIRFINKSALLSYFIHNLKLRNNLVQSEIYDWLTGKTEKNIKVEPKDEMPDILTANKYYFEKTFELNKGKKVAILLGSRLAYVYGEMQMRTRDSLLIDQTTTLTSKYNFDLLRQFEPFKKDWDKNHKRFNHVVDGHWTEYGHKLAGDILIKYIRSLDTQSLDTLEYN